MVVQAAWPACGANTGPELVARWLERLHVLLQLIGDFLADAIHVHRQKQPGRRILRTNSIESEAMRGDVGGKNPWLTRHAQSDSCLYPHRTYSHCRPDVEVRVALVARGPAMGSMGGPLSHRRTGVKRQCESNHFTHKLGTVRAMWRLRSSSSPYSIFGTWRCRWCRWCRSEVWERVKCETVKPCKSDRQEYGRKTV